MSTYTKEQLIARINQVTAINKFRISRDPYADGLAMDNELLAIALASLEAEKGVEPVAKVETVVVCWYADNGVPRKPAVGTELFSAPPAPVSVPSGYRLQPISEYDAMCAAMLQGADGNSPVIPDGLNIRAVAALREAVRNQWLKSDEFAEKIYWKNMHDIANEIVMAMLAAAPQQEVK